MLNKAGWAEVAILHTDGTLSIAAPGSQAENAAAGATAQQPFYVESGIAGDGIVDGSGSPRAQTEEDAKLQSTLAVRKYLSEAFRLYPHVVGPEIKSKLWRDRHDMSWDDTKQVSDLVNELSGWSLQEKIDFFRLVAFRKVYKVSVWDPDRMMNVDLFSSVDPRKKRKGKRQWSRGQPVERVTFHKLPRLPPLPLHTVAAGLHSGS